MIEVILTMCMLADPRHCQEVRILRTPDGGFPSPVFCFLQSQSIGAAWVNRHRGWYLANTKCEKPGRSALT